jgi:hypothetical protein
MHHHCEIVMPPTADINAMVAQILKQFDENAPAEVRSHAFWDFWVIGGRFAGRKLIAQYDQAKLDQFEEWCQTEKITVSGITAGKQELKPDSQISKVDAKWNEMFPSDTFMACPLFKHSNDQYGKGLSGALPQDVVCLKDLPSALTCTRVIIAAPNYNNEIEAEFMLVDDAWNGCNYMKVEWDGKVQTALTQFQEKTKHYKDEYAEKHTPKDDWLVVTVDYHS